MVSNTVLKRVISPQSVADNTALVGQIIDHQGADSVTYDVLLGSLGDADATFATLLEHGDAANLSDAVAVPDENMLTQTPGTAPEAAASFTFAHDDQVRVLGYNGSKRYSRLTITPTGNASAALIAASARLGMRNTPVTQPAS